MSTGISEEKYYITGKRVKYQEDKNE